MTLKVTTLKTKDHGGIKKKSTLTSINVNYLNWCVEIATNTRIREKSSLRQARKIIQTGHSVTLG